MNIYYNLIYSIWERLVLDYQRKYIDRDQLFRYLNSDAFNDLACYLPGNPDYYKRAIIRKAGAA